MSEPGEPEPVRTRIEMRGDPEGHRRARQEAMALLWGFWRGEDAYGSELSRVVSNLISKRVPAENVGDIARELAYVLDAASTLTVFAIEHVQELGVSREVAMRQLEDEVERRAAELFG